MPKKLTPPRTEDPLEQFMQECRDMLNAALPKHNALSGFQKTVFQWPPEIVEWVKAETGIEPESNDPARKNRTDFETALQLLLRERTGYDLKDLEDGLPTSEYVQLARVAARIKGYREKAGATPDKVEVKANGIPKAAADTWVKRFGVKGAKWEDISITVAPGGTVVTFIPTGKPIIEVWDHGFLGSAPGHLLEFFQATKTLPNLDKVTVSRLRTTLKRVSGISEDPFISEGGGTYTRIFDMGLRGRGAVSEYSDGSRGEGSDEFFGPGFHVETH